MENNSTKGTCMLMCPEAEIEMRQREGLLHILETRQGRPCRKGEHVTADRRKMVKMFSRSAAGRDMLRAEELRPLPVLKKTLNYLLGTVVCESHLPWSTVYTFVSDRLRAVRQDMVIQQPPATICSSILEPMVRFHAYSAYRLCEESQDVFDPHLNGSHLNETLKQLLVCYDSAPARWEDGDGMSPCRDQMEALYGLLHLGNIDALYRMLLLTPTQGSLLSTALRMSLAHFRNDYVTVCRLLHRLPPLLTCVVVQHLPFIRRKALSVMSSAYSSRNLRYPVAQLTQLLLYADDTETIKECQHYGLTVDDAGVHFLKGSFDLSVEESVPKRLQFVDDILEPLSLPELLLAAGQPES